MNFVYLAWAKALAVRTGPRKAKVALARNGRHTARHMALQHALPGSDDDIGHEIENALIIGTQECVQPGRAARVRSVPRLRQ